VKLPHERALLFYEAEQRGIVSKHIIGDPTRTFRMRDVLREKGVVPA
jgi:hypothetical protein